MLLAILLTLCAPSAPQADVCPELRPILPDLRRIDRMQGSSNRHVVSDARVRTLEDRLGRLSRRGARRQFVALGPKHGTKVAPQRSDQHDKHQRLADLARLVELGETGSSSSQLAGLFIQAIIEMRQEMELPLQPQGLKPQDIPDIVEEALTEAGALYPVPRYMSADEVRNIVNGLLAA